MIYRWRGVDPRGNQRLGQMDIEQGYLAPVVEHRFRQGWKLLTVCSGPGPVPPPAIGPADVVAEIKPHPETGRRTWWAGEEAQS